MVKSYSYIQVQASDWEALRQHSHWSLCRVNQNSELEPDSLLCVWVSGFKEISCLR